MFETTPGERGHNARPELQFVMIELFPAREGLLSVSVSATSVDEENLEFINADLGTVRVASLDEALVAIRNSVTPALYPSAFMEVQ